jgi:hypothetical protein
MPTGRHCFNDSSNHKITTLVAARCKQNVKVTFAILAPFKLIENAVLEVAKALGASAQKKNSEIYKVEAANGVCADNDLHKTLSMPQLTVGVDNFFVRFKALITSTANHRTERHVAGDSVMGKRYCEFLLT